MKTLLTVTVGGSCAPIITAIQEYKPDYVCFIVTTGQKGSEKTVNGTGNPCGDPRKAKCPECNYEFYLGNPKGANILTQTGLTEDQCQIIKIDEPDAFEICYPKMRQTLVELQVNHNEWRRIADYTGGTKTMTAALAAAALELNWELSLVRGSRMNLEKVRNGTEMVALVNAADVRARQGMNEARRMFNAYDYTSAEEILKSYLRAAPISTELRHEIQKWVTLCRAFDTWDRFDHITPRELLEPYKKDFLDQWLFLEKITSNRSAYALVLDLQLNAERRASQGRYDDAVARLYRMLELFAQIHMQTRKPNLNSSDIAVEKLPPDLQETYIAKRQSDGKIRLGLREDYELLEALGDPLGQVYTEYKDRLLNAMKHRNSSILAHGTTPVAENEWNEMKNIVYQFIEQGLKNLKVRIKATQFPQWEEYN